MIRSTSEVKSELQILIMEAGREAETCYFGDGADSAVGLAPSDRIEEELISLLTLAALIAILLGFK